MIMNIVTKILSDVQKDFHLQIGERLVARYAIFTTGDFHHSQDSL